MKHYSTLLLLFLLLFFLNACDEDDDQPDEPNYGAEYFECKINGEPFQAVSDFTCSGPQFDYYPESFMDIPEGYAFFSGRHCPSGEAAVIRINGLEHQTGLLLFNEPTFADSIFPLYRYIEADGSIIKFETLVNGQIYIEQFEPRVSGTAPLGTIKGTFEYTVTNELGMDTIRVTEGRFRFDVPQIF